VEEGGGRGGRGGAQGGGTMEKNGAAVAGATAQGEKGMGGGVRWLGIAWGKEMGGGPVR
jgi:hypothetical protein